MTDQFAPRPGRPVRVSPEVERIFCEAIARGASYQLAAQAAGIGASTWRDWHAAAEDDDPDTPPYFGRVAAFVKAVKEAEARYSLDRLDAIKAAGHRPEHWTAAAWLVERRHPEYRQSSQVEYSGTVAHTLQLVDLAALVPPPGLPPGAGTLNPPAIEARARETTAPLSSPAAQPAAQGLHSTHDPYDDAASEDEDAAARRWDEPT